MLLSNTRGLLRLIVGLVVAEENVLEAGLVARKRNHRIPCRRLDHRIRGSLDRDPHRPVVELLDLDDAIEAREDVGSNGLREVNGDLVALDVLQLRDAGEADEPAVADDADARARLLDLAQHVGGQKHGAAFPPRLVDHAVELLLVQRVEAAGGLVEDQHTRLVHEGLDEHDLALVAGRVLAKLATRVQVEAIDQRFEVRPVHTAAKVGEVLEDLPAGQVVVERRLARDVADELLDPDGFLPAVQAADPSGATVGAQERHEDADGRGLAGTVRTEESENLALADVECHVDDSALAAVALAELLDLDDRRHVASSTRTTLEGFSDRPCGWIPCVRPGPSRMRG